MSRLLLALAALVAGGVTGAAAVLLHQRWWWLAIALLATSLAVWWLPDRLPRVAWALAWGGAVLRGALSRPEGDYLVSSNALGWTLLGGSVLALLAALVLPDHTPRPGDDRGIRAPST